MRGALGLVRAELPFLFIAATAILFETAGAPWLEHLGNPLVLVVLFLWLFGVMLWGALSAVHHADELAEILGEPLGTLILTVAVTVIEISVIAAVMLHAGPNPTLARDTMLAVLIIVLDGMVGLALLVGGIRHREQSFNLQGARAYLSVLLPLATVTLILPRFTTSTPGPTLAAGQSLAFAAATVLLYGTFLALQTTRHRDHFAEVVAEGGTAADVLPTHGRKAKRKGSLFYNALLLVLILVPIVLLSKKFAVIVDYGTDAVGLPVALGGVVVAILVLAPEGLAAFEAAAANHLQRSVNVCLGSALATISLTVPAVIGIAWMSGLTIELGLDASEMVILLLTLVVSMLTFGAVRTNMLQGAVHLVVFFVYLVLVFQP